MNQKITRRRFVAATGLAALTSPIEINAVPQVSTTRSAKPVVISSANGNIYKDKEGLTCVAKSFQMLTQGADVLDSVIAGVNILELDPEETSVGYGGLPNADGIVQLDASVMHGTLKKAAGVACLEGVRTPSLVAKKVMDETDHVLLVGKDAQRFARNMGFKIEEDLNTEKSRKLWLEWKHRTDPEHYPNNKERAQAGHKAGLEMVRDGLIDPDHFYGTINCNALNLKGELAGVTTTSGLAWKIPGRVGDSPIVGAGLYVDGEVGAAGSTGRGEANLFSLCSFLIVEQMRGGVSPKDAGMAALKRIVASTRQKHLLNKRGQPNFGVSFYVLSSKGQYAGVSMYELSGSKPVQFAICTEDGPQTLKTEPLFAGQSED